MNDPVKTVNRSFSLTLMSMPCEEHQNPTLLGNSPVQIHGVVPSLHDLAKSACQSLHLKFLMIVGVCSPDSFLVPSNEEGRLTQP